MAKRIFVGNWLTEVQLKYSQQRKMGQKSKAENNLMHRIIHGEYKTGFLSRKCIFCCLLGCLNTEILIIFYGRYAVNITYYF